MAGETSRKNGAKSNGTSRVTKTIWAAYCEHVANGDKKAIAARKVGVPYRTLRYHRQHNDEYAAQLAEAEIESVDVFEQVLVEIARGEIKQATMVRFYSTIALLRKRDPEGGWRDAREHDKEPETRDPTKLDFSKLSRTELDRLCDLLARAVAEQGEAPLGVLPR